MKEIGRNWFSSKIFDSKVQSADITKGEKWVGYLFGPGGVLLLGGIVGGFLNVYYTDVLKLTRFMGGAFLVLFPILSKILDAITNLIMGQIVDRTRSRQGKARPWLFISAPLVCVTGILVILIPQASETVQAIWILVSYNLFFSFAYTIYAMSHQVMMPLSTRETKQRDTLGMFNNIGYCMVPGLFAAILFPMFILPWMGVDRSRWIAIVSIFSIIAMPCILLEYYFTKERITEARMGLEDEEKKHSFLTQLKACLSSKYWRMIMGWQIAVTLINGVTVASMIYYCNWVLGTYNDGTTMMMYNTIGQFPLGFGIFLIWPFVKKVGKRNAMLWGSVLAIVGNVLTIIDARSLPFVLGGLFLASIGTLPSTYLGNTMIPDTMEHIEYKTGFRCDAFSASIYSIFVTVAAGIGAGVLNWGLAAFGYIPPVSNTEWVAQPAAVQTFLIIACRGLVIVSCLVQFLTLKFYDLDKKLPEIQAELKAHREAKLANGLYR